MCISLSSYHFDSGGLLVLELIYSRLKVLCHLESYSKYPVNMLALLHQSRISVLVYVIHVNDSLLPFIFIYSLPAVRA
jgi:hypothetical protein